MLYREYLRFTGIGAFFVFITLLINPVLSPYIRALGFNEFQIGIIFSLFPLSIILFSPIMGRVSDVLGREIAILFGILMEIAAMVLYVTGGSYLFISVARVVNAIGYITVVLAVLAKLEDSVDGKTRGRYVGWSLSIEHASRMVAPVIGGLVADMLFVTAPFMLSAALLALLLVYFLKSRPRKAGTLSRRDLNPVKEIREFLSDRGLRGVGVLGIVMHASMPATTVFLPLMLIDRFSVNFTYVGVAFFAMGFFHIFQFYFGRLSDQRGRKAVLLPGTLVFGVCLLLVCLSSSYVMLLIVLLFMGMGGAMWNISAWSLLSDLGESSKREGQTIMTYASIAKMGAFISYILSGFVAQHYGTGILFVLNGIAVLAGTAAACLIWRGRSLRPEGG